MYNMALFGKNTQPIQASPNTPSPHHAPTRLTNKNFSIFGNCPNYFHFFIYKLSLQKIFYISYHQNQRNGSGTQTTFPFSASTLIIFGFSFINFLRKNIFVFHISQIIHRKIRKINPT